METSKVKVFKINKDPEKRKFIKTHSFNNISNYNLNASQNINKNKLSSGKIDKDKIILKVILNYSYQKDYFIFSLPTKIIYNQDQNVNQFCLNDIIDLIYSYSNDKTIFLNNNYSISYYTNDESDEKEEDIKTYCFIGNYPLDKNTNYYINIPSDGVLYLKFRKRISKVKSLRYDIFEEENEEEIEEVAEQSKNTAQLNYNVESKRANEKRIGFVVKKIFQWKGFRKYTDNKMSLIEAAKNVRLSKKTLDEYFNQIKEGIRYNFDFNKHKKDKVNILRGYVKKMNNQDINRTKLERKIRNKKKNN